MPFEASGSRAALMASVAGSGNHRNQAVHSAIQSWIEKARLMGAWPVSQVDATEPDSRMGPNSTEPDSRMSGGPNDSSMGQQFVSMPCDPGPQLQYN